MKLHTLMVLVGPSNSGKSQFAKKLKQVVEDTGLHCTVVSSDAIRLEILGENLARQHSRMDEVSKPAFDLLEAKVRAAMAYPVNTELVIVDSTGLNEAFRQSMQAIAAEYGYHCDLTVFNLDKQYLAEHIKNQIEMDGHSGNADWDTTTRQLTRMREQVLPALDKKSYNKVTVFKNPGQVKNFFNNLQQDQGVFSDLARYQNTVLEVGAKTPVAVVGDVHECVEALDRLVKELPEEAPIVFAGDLIDHKVGDKPRPAQDNLESVLDYVLELASKRTVKIVAGNHERYAYRRVLGQINPQLELEKTYFTSVQALLQGGELRLNKGLFDKLDKVMKMSTPFVKITGLKADRLTGRRTAFVTHAPVKLRHIGKMNEDAIKAQANFYFEKRDDDDYAREALSFVAKQSDTNLPTHLFGHVALEGQAVRQKNSIWLDTGVVMGGSLTAAILVGDNVMFRSVKAHELYENQPRLQLQVKPVKHSLEAILESEFSLEEHEERLVSRVIAGRAQFISGTMPPAPSRGSDIESLQACLEHFAKQGVEKLVLQPKFMGSRCQAYLKRGNPEASFLVSRNGLEIGQLVEKPAVIEALLKRFEDFDYQDELVLDGELLPWHALGKGLIEHDFNDYARAIDYQLSELVNDKEFAQLSIAQKVNPQGKREMLNLFEKQLQLYAQPGEPRFQAFSVLRVDGQLWTHKDQAEVFDLVGNCPYLVVNPGAEDALAKASEFFDKLTTEQGMEGIVAKPAVVDLEKGQTPYMKVRNKDYLTLIYGYEYKNRMQRLAENKKIGRKLQLAVTEYRLGNLMLLHPEHRDKLVYAMFGYLSQEKTLDPRL